MNQMIIIDETDHNVNLSNDLPVPQSVEGTMDDHTFDCPLINSSSIIHRSFDRCRKIDREFESSQWYSDGCFFYPH